MTEDVGRIALLIDADNTQISKIESAILEISKYGKILVKRAYGNWAKASFKNWEDTFRELAIKPIYQIDYVKGKNATDMALIIDAMDFLYNSEYDGFAIMSSDSDFTPLAIKLRESGKFVFGIGAKKSSEAFVESCHKFIYLENLSAEKTLDTKNEHGEKSSGRKKVGNTELDNLIKIVYETYQNDDDDFVDVSIAGSYIKRVKPDFDITLFGVKKFTDYFRKYPDLYEIKGQKSGNKMIFAYRVKD